MGQRRRGVEGEHEFWRLVLETWRGSGMSIAGLCRREGLAASSFHQWRRRLESVVEEGAAVFLPVKVTRPQEQEEVIALDATGHCSASPIELVLTCGVRVQVREGFEVATLRRVVEALR